VDDFVVVESLPACRHAGFSATREGIVRGLVELDVLDKQRKSPLEPSPISYPAFKAMIILSGSCCPCSIVAVPATSASNTLLLAREQLLYLPMFMCSVDID
jgi:hypothetical protein